MISVSIISATSSVIWVSMGWLWLAGPLVSSSVYPHLTSTIGTSTVGSSGGSGLETSETAKLPQSVSLAHLLAKKRRSIISLSSMCHAGQWGVMGQSITPHSYYSALNLMTWTESHVGLKWHLWLVIVSQYMQIFTYVPGTNGYNV